MPTISGIVYDDTGAPAVGRVVRAYRRDTGALLAETTTSAGGVGDPFFSSVGLLMHMDGANGSTTFTDVSPTPKTATVFGGAQISTAASKFGGASGRFNGTDAYITYAQNPAFTFGEEDFTVEFWVNFDQVSAQQHLLDFRTGSTGQLFVRIFDGTLWVYWNFGSSAVWYSGGLATGVFYHVAISRQSGTTRMFVNGVLSSSSASVTNFPSSSLTIGAVNGGGSHFAGYLDDLRVTKGVARYTANFTPPTAAFLGAGSESGAGIGTYSIPTTYSGEVNVVALDDSIGTAYNDLILRTTPV